MACYIATYGLIGLFVLFAVCCLLFSGTAIARFKRASGSCAGTKRQAVGLQPAEADHVPAWVHGFTNAREAIRWRCLSCHGGKSTTEGTTLRVRKDDLKVRDQKVVVNNAGGARAGGITAPQRSQSRGKRECPEKVPQSQHKGVVWQRTRGKWMARIRIGTKQRHLGSFAKEEHAAAACREAAATIAQGDALPARPRPAQTSSQHRGVSWHKGRNKASGRWEAKISVDGKRRHLGYFADEEAAAAACTTARLGKAAQASPTA